VLLLDNRLFCSHQIEAAFHGKSGYPSERGGCSADDSKDGSQGWRWRCSSPCIAHRRRLEGWLLVWSGASDEESDGEGREMKNESFFCAHLALLLFSLHRHRAQTFPSFFLPIRTGCFPQRYCVPRPLKLDLIRSQQPCSVISGTHSKTQEQVSKPSHHTFKSTGHKVRSPVSIPTTTTYPNAQNSK